nr:MAG TPA: hypothetical protein [Bacteriophage sp.]DAT16768.1 MAG TPA: hypothetical protein [Caudoviricetes sp.]
MELILQITQNLIKLLYLILMEQFSRKMGNTYILI